MRKLGFTMLAIFIGLSTFAQKDELKAVEKALKGGNAATAKSAIVQAQGLIANADDKTKAKFYFLKAKTYYDLAKKNPAAADASYETAATSFQDLIAFEKKTGKARYTKEAQPMLNELIGDVSKKAIDDYDAKNYASAKKGLYQTYMLSKKDTSFLMYSANAAYLDKDFDTALERYISLKDLGYTGIVTTYSATNIKSGEKENFPSKSQMDLMIKAKQNKDPEVNVSESKKASIIRNIASILSETGKPEEALAAIIEARKLDPEDMDMLNTQAFIYLKLGKKEEFRAAMREAIVQDPTNPALHFNIGVINQEQGNIEEAKVNYKKAIEIDPNYVDAYLNLGAAMLEKDKVLVEEMNDNLSNFKKYDAVKEKQKELYKEVLPVYEKVYTLSKELKRDNLDIVRTLMSMYENLEMDDKYKEMRAIWDASKE